MLTTFEISLLILFIRFAISLTDEVLLLARVPISDATTENPFPASPALAASIEALSARRFVLSAISPIIDTILFISSDDFPTSSITSFNSY